MAIKDLLVAYDGTAAADAALKLGALIAGKHKAQLTSLLAHGAAEDYAANARWIGAETRDILNAASSQALDEARNRFSARAKDLGLKDAPLLDEAGRPDLVVAEFAKFHDVTVLGKYGGETSDARLILHPDRIAMKSGRPLIVVPESFDRDAPPDQHLVFAWGGGRSAARAIADATQIVDSGTRVTIVTVGESVPASAGRDMEAHLKRHGMKTENVRLEMTGEVGRTILDFAEQHAPDLLVMGAYEFSKFREDFFGGVTDTVLRQTTVPVLLSH